MWGAYFCMGAYKHDVVVVIKMGAYIHGCLFSMVAYYTIYHVCYVHDLSLFSTAVNCGTLTNPVNGRVSHSGGTTFGHRATYSCDTGYNLVGSSTRTCQSTRRWSGSAPTCQRMLFLLNVSSSYAVYMKSSSFSTAVNCGTLTNPANGQVSHPAGTTFRQTATYRCNTGYNLVGNRARTCQARRTWSGSAPTCQRMLLLKTVSTIIYLYM